MSQENAEFKQLFLEESFDLLIKTQAALQELISGVNTAKNINEVFRNVHTIKGGASMFELKNTAVFCHEFETELSQLKKEFETQPDLELKIEVIQNYLEKVLKIETLLKNNDQDVASPNIMLSSPSSTIESKNQEILRVPLEKINSVLDHVWEVFLIRNQLSYLVDQYRKDFEKSHIGFIQGFEALDTLLKRNINDIEQKTMSMRMSNVKTVFQRMNKVINDYCAKSSKTIQLTTFGEDIELDKKIIDMLAEPLIHLVRNAIDHGIEDSINERRALNKKDVGQVTLKAGLEGTNAYIEITDDGRGIDAEKIKYSAQNKGLDTKHVQTEEQAIHLIFEPGFSTATEVTDVSGRGVGMDVVKSSVEAMGGRITIRTQIGEGTTFKISIPTGVSVVQALEIKINQSTYAIDADQIIRTKKIALSELKKNLGCNYIYYENDFIPCIETETLFNSNSTIKKSSEKQSICVVQFNGQTFGLLVDEINNSSTLVTKRLPDICTNDDLISAVSLLQSGRPVFLLSIEKILKCFSDQQKGNKEYGKAA